MTAQTPRVYSSRSQQTTLTSTLLSSATVASVTSVSALLGGATVSTGQTFTVVIDPDTSLEEIVDVTATNGTTQLTITRAIDGSGAQDHSAGAIVRHMVIGRDLREANSHEVATTGVHGLANTSSVVGTLDTQTLSNKTLVAPILTSTLENDSGVHFSGATPGSYTTFLTVTQPTANNTVTIANTSGNVVIDTAAQTLTNKTLTSPTISGSPSITGLSNPSNSSDAANKAYVDSILGSATAASTSAASAATSAASAATSQTAAATSASSAAASATAAATSATSAAASATAAATSATSAAASATAAATSATSAGGYVTTVAASATAAATSATSAAASATAAATSATSSATSASAALTSANSAATSAASAATSATSSATSASSSLATYNTYKTYYLGSFTTAPTLDNQGNALITGATYYNSSTTTMYVYTGSTWVAISNASAVTAVSGTSGNITSTGGSTPVINLATAGTAGTYGHPSTITTDAYGRVTSATTGSVTGTGNYVLQTNPTLTLPTIGNAVFGLTNVSVSGGTTNLSSSDNQQIYFSANGSNNSHTVVLPSTATLAVGEYFDLTNITHLGTNANVTVNLYGGAGLLTLYPAQSVVVTVLSTSSNTSGAWNVFYDGSSTVTGTGSAMFATSPTIATPTINGATITGTVTSTATVSGGTLNNATLTGTLTAGGSAGTSGYYLQTTGTGVQWATVTALPSQTGNSGKYLTTNGTTASWAAVSTDPIPQILMLGGM